jgi:DNA repair exonuclease SbcCD ATPase subunit
MFIHIKGFRSIQNLEFEFNQDSVTLISGPSGAGKSTLMNAILWCLYGSLRNVRKFGNKSGKCMVKLTLDSDTTILRSKSPEALKLTYRGSEMCDKEAQEKIIDLFGTQDKWIACCYLRQGSRNLFLDSSACERLELLSKICFSNKDPGEYIEKIEDSLNSSKSEFNTKNEILKIQIDQYHKKIEEFKSIHNITNIRNGILTEHQKLEYENKINDMILQDLEQNLKRAWEAKSERQILSTQLSDLINNFVDYQCYIPYINSKDTLLVGLSLESDDVDAKLESLERKQIKRDNLQTELAKQKQLLHNYKDYENLDLQTFTDQESEINQKLKHIQDFQRRKFIKTKLTEIQDKLDKLSDLKTIESQILNLEIEIEQQRKIKLLQNEFEKLKSEIGSCWDSIQEKNVCEDEIQQSMIFERKKQQREKTLFEIDLDLNSTKEQVEKAIEKRKLLIRVQPFLQHSNQLIQKENRMDAIHILIDQLGKRNDWIQEKDLPSKMIEHQTSLDLLQCPSCKVHLKYENNLLVNASKEDRISKLKPSELLKWIEDSKKRIEWKKEFQRLETEFKLGMTELSFGLEKINLNIETLSQYPVIEEEALEKLYQEIVLLETIPDIQLDYIPVQKLHLMMKKWKGIQIQNEMIEQDQLDLENLFQRRDSLLDSKSKRIFYEKEIIQLAKQLEKISETEEYDLDSLISNLHLCKDIQNKIIKSQQILELEKEWQPYSALDSEIQSVREQKVARDKLKKIEKAIQILNLKEMISKLECEEPDQIQVKINDFKKSKKEYEDKLRIDRLATMLMDEKEKIRKEREQVILLQNKFLSLSKIKMLANELEHKRMITTLSSIGDFANDILLMLFDEPIRIEFDVFKTSKNQKTTKPNINYKILYKGNEIDSIDQLSGGEADRVSLAVTCAMFRFSNFPFLMLDEFASSLDLNNKEMAIQTLKTMIGGQDMKSILCISHDTVEGIYDHHFKF